MTALARIAEWVTADHVFTERQRALAIDAIIDTIACMAAGRDDSSTKSVAAVCGDTDVDRGARAIDGRIRSAAATAFLNGTAAHALDFDDNFVVAATHASAVLVPALAAVGQMRATTGAELVDAYLIGLQAQALIGEPIAIEHYTAGWHATSTIGTIGTAAATAALLGLDASGVVNAMSIATSSAAGLKVQFGTSMKPVHAGLAARNAVEAAQLAAAGLSGRTDVLEADRGFRDLYGASSTAGWPTDLMPEKSDHAIEVPGLLPKIHPCCGSTHQAIDAVIELQRANGFDAAEVEGVVVKVLRANAGNLPYAVPRNEMEARFSMQYCIDVALDRGGLTLSDFTQTAVDERASDPRLGRTTLTTWSSEEERAFLAQRRMPHEVVVTLRDGRRLRSRRETARGSIAEPFTVQERRTKFTDCLGGAGDVHDDLLLLDKAGDLDAVDRALLFAAGGDVR